MKGSKKMSTPLTKDSARLLYNQNGEIWKAAVQAFKSEAKTPLPVGEWDQNEATVIWNDLQYAGFDAPLIYAAFMLKSGSKGKTAIKVISACISLGNNYVLRSKRVTNQATGEEIRAFLSGLDVTTKKTTTSSLTPSRLCSVFPFLTLMIRLEMEKAGTLSGPGFETTTPLVWCDLGLTPLSEANPAMMDFLTKMAKQLNAARKRVNKEDKTTDEDAVTRMEAFRKIQTESYKASAFRPLVEPSRLSVGNVLAMYGFK